MLQGLDRGDAQNVAFQFARQFVVLEHDVERLIPRHVIEHDGQRAVHVRIEHHVQSADFVDQAEEVFQVDIFQVDRDRLTRVLRSGCDAFCCPACAFCSAARFTAGVIVFGAVL